MAKEELTAPAVMNNTTGTIECEILANNVIKTNGLNNYFIDTADGDGNNQISVLDDSSNNLTITTKASDAATSVSYADSNLTLDTVRKVGATYNASNLKLFTDGTSRENPELLTPNQKTGTDTLGDTTGFDKAGANTIISSSTEQAHTGTKSLKATTNGDGPNEGTWTTTTTVTPHTTYIAGAWVYAPTGTKMRITALYDANNLAYTDFTATGTWQWIEQNTTTDTYTTLKIGIRTNGIYKINFYTDDLSLKAMSTPPNLPASKQTVKIGSDYSGASQANTVIKNVVFGKDLRSDSNIANRALRDGFGVDRQVTLIAPLKNNLNAYRVATV